MVSLSCHFGCCSCSVSRLVGRAERLGGGAAAARAGPSLYLTRPVEPPTATSGSRGSVTQRGAAEAGTEAEGDSIFASGAVAGDGRISPTGLEILRKPLFYLKCNNWIIPINLSLVLVLASGRNIPLNLVHWQCVFGLVLCLRCRNNNN